MADSTFRLALVRHAETYANVEKVWHGQTDTALTLNGQRQAQLLGEGFQHFMVPDVIYASPLQRTRNTAQAIANQHGLEVRLDPRLMELHLGDWEGLAFADLRDKMDVIHDPSFVPPGGESQLQVLSRMLTAIEEIVLRHSNDNVALVTHGVAIAVVIADYLHGDTTRWVEYTTKNTAICELCPSSRNLLSFNHFEHLGED